MTEGHDPSITEEQGGGADQAPPPRAGSPDPEPEEPVESDHATVLDILRAIKSGQVNPRNVRPDDRRLCVAHLVGEGLSVSEVAQVLRISVRTVARDRRAINEENAIQPDARLAGLYAGRLAAEAEATIGRIRRVTRDKDTPHAIKIDGEFKCYDILDRFVQRLQSMGYLPTAAHRIQADLTHNTGDLSSLAELKAELTRLESIDAECRVIESDGIGDAMGDAPEDGLPDHAGEHSALSGLAGVPMPRAQTRVERERLEEQDLKRRIEEKWRTKKPDVQDL